MKDFLNYYYYIIPDKIHKVNNNYYFNFKNNYFSFIQYLGNINELSSLYNLNNYMLYQNKSINKIILNKENNIITKKDNNYYILILLNTYSKNLININNVINFINVDIYFPNLDRTNWYILWSNKIDYLEYIRNNLNKEYNLIYNSLPYYIGLTENAISYLKYSNLKNNHIGIQHTRVSCKNNLMDFYNPINLIIDYKVRDIAEYFKSLFFDSKLDIKEIINKIKLIKMNEIDSIYFYIRMLYPSYYFDIVDNILKGKLKQEELLNITKLSNDYEYLLYEIYSYIKSKYNIIGIEWINKKYL